MQEKKLSFKAKRLLFSNMLFRSGKLITSIFLNIFLWKNTHDIKIIAIFNIVFHLFYSITYTFLARIIKNGYRNIFLSIGVFGTALIYLGLLLFGKEIINYYILLALLLGIFDGIYWIIYNNNEFDLTNIKNRGNYQGLKKSFKTIIGIAIPSIIGTIIGLNLFGYGYQIAFGIGMLFFLFSGFFGIIKIDYHTGKEKFLFLQTCKLIGKEKDLLKMVFIFGLLGFALSNSLIDVILPVLLYNNGLEEMKLGFLISFFSILTIIVSYIFGKYVDYSKYKLTVLISSGIYILLSILLIFFPNYWFIILFSAILNLLYTFIDIPKSVYGANILEKIKNFKKFKTEYIVIVGLSLAFGRILSFLVMYFIGNINNVGIKILFGIMSLMIFISALLFVSLKD